MGAVISPQLDELLENERVIVEALGDQPYDFVSMAAISNIYRAAAAVRRRAEAGVLAQVPLSWGGFTAMWVLRIWGPMETGRLAVECDLSKGTLSGILNTLEGRSFVERERMAEDRRRMLVGLTAEGARVIGELIPKFNAFETESASGLDTDQKRELAALLRTIIADLDDVG